MTTPTAHQLLANDIIKRYPCGNPLTKSINEMFKVTFAGITLDCRCEFIRGNEYRDYYRIAIESENLFDDDDNCYLLFLEVSYLENKDEDYNTQIMNMLQWNKDILNNLVYDNKQGKLIDSRVSRTITQIQEIDDIRMNFMGDMILNKMDECCVCYEKTNSKTDCGHSICLLCATKVKKEEGERKCPMCRGHLTMS